MRSHPVDWFGKVAADCSPVGKWGLPPRLMPRFRPRAAVGDSAAGGGCVDNVFGMVDPLCALDKASLEAFMFSENCCKAASEALLAAVPLSSGALRYAIKCLLNPIVGCDLGPETFDFVAKGLLILTELS